MWGETGSRTVVRLNKARMCSHVQFKLVADSSNPSKPNDQTQAMSQTYKNASKAPFSNYRLDIASQFKNPLQPCAAVTWAKVILQAQAM
jgi:hypothetical protein